MKIEKTQIESYLSDSYLKYAGYVAQNRAIVDSRDGLKAGGRKILYAMFVNGHGSNKTKTKGTKVVGEIMSYSVHGAGPIYGNLVRFGQPYSLRYPLVDAQGNVGTMRGGDDYSADRYLEFRLDKKAEDILKNLKKDTIASWHDTYDGTQQFPSVLPAYFPNVLVNGNTGIGVGLASSIPQFNLREVCDVLIKAVTNSNLSFQELYCAPDFATGGILVNEPEIKGSLEEGKGKAVSLVAKMIYDIDTNEIVVKELPYQVFTQTIAEQLAAALLENRLPGVESFFDGTEYDENPIKTNIRIKLTKHANVNKIISQLYKETSLKNHFGINMVMLEDGRVPKIYGWVEMIYTYLKHLKNMIRKSYEWDLNEHKQKLHIITGFLRAIDIIDEIIQDIKKSVNVLEAKRMLVEKYLFSEEQSKAILDMKLSRLAKLEKEKLEQEKKELEREIKHCEYILGPGFDEEVIREITNIKAEYGDNRRTEIRNMSFGENIEPAEKKELVVHISEKGTVLATEASQYMIQSRGGKGMKIKLRAGDVLKESITGLNSEYILLLSNQGKSYHLYLNELEIGKETHFKSLLSLGENEEIITLLPYSKINNYNYVIFLTKNGTVKKTKISEYLTKNKNGLAAIKLREDDKLVSISFVKDNEEVFIVSKQGYIIRVENSDFSTTARATMGVIGIKLNDGDEALTIIPIEEKSCEICSITEKGLVKRTLITEFNKTNRATKGVQIQKLKEEDSVASVVCLTESDKSVIIISETNTIRISIEDIPLLGRQTQGNQSMTTGSKIVKMLISNT